ncbi:MAG: hypothetical protein IJ661_06040 [Lachnospiraceae bacterium]|nr:hypothetical protein [Lachnospiraceae bacterium]
MAGLNISPYQAYNQTHNYSSLFASINKSNADNGWDLSGLADYASIKNGSYGKLVRSSYAKANSTSSDSNSNTKSTIMTAEERRKAREAAQANASSAAGNDSNTELTGAAARRAAREAKANKTATTGEDEKALTTADVDKANIGSTTADAASAIAKEDSSKAIYNSNAVASPSMSELMAATFDTNV